MSRLASMMLGATLAIAPAFVANAQTTSTQSQTGSGTTMNDQNRNDQSSTNQGTSTNDQGTTTNNDGSQMPRTSANWLAMLLSGSTLSAAGLMLRRKR